MNSPPSSFVRFFVRFGGEHQIGKNFESVLYEFDFSVKSLKCGNSYKSGFYC
ncbi:hypothetical protein LEP1GSC126_0835 [Leptospira kirschneri str. 200801774]|nr:hypothetical protein LEP1GSC198_1599 [Leptospira kirschneri str. JB]EMK09735.1 hypothetical protein LEP1GSC166_1308 [Leptospira kirschneri]EMO79968.1 hypothetical protein LEP1GSC126_0835 [Leptospira kirschneri str. 200801774]